MARTIFPPDGPGIIQPNGRAWVDRDEFIRDTWRWLTAREAPGEDHIIDHTPLAGYNARFMAQRLGFSTDDPVQAVAYLNQIIRYLDNPVPGWSFVLNGSGLTMEFNRADAVRFHAARYAEA